MWPFKPSVKKPSFKVENAEYRGSSKTGYIELYFQQLVGQFKTLSNPPATPALNEARMIAETIPVEEITWADVYRLENALLQLAPVDDLRRRAWTLRAEFAEAAGPARNAVYLASNPPDADKASEADLRADLEQLLREVHWLYTILPVQGQIRSTLSQRTAVYTGALLLVVIVWTTIYFHFKMPGKGEPEIQSLAVAIVAGALGGLISTQRRIQSAVFPDNIVISLVEMAKSSLSVFVSPLIGAVFAVVLLLIFKGKLIGGETFPTFNDATLATSAVSFDLHSVAQALQPTNAVEFAKLTIWCFIAGFAEQLVPDMLSRVANAVQQKQPAQ